MSHTHPLSTLEGMASVLDGPQNLADANKQQLDTIKLLARFLQHRDPKAW